MKNSEIKLNEKSVNAVISNIAQNKFFTAANEANESFKTSKQAVLENAAKFGKAVKVLKDDILKTVALSLKDKDGNPKTVDSLSNIEKAPVVTAISKHFGYSKDYLNDLTILSEYFTEVLSIAKKHEIYGKKETEIYGVVFETPETITLNKAIQVAKKLKSGSGIPEINDFLSGKTDEKKASKKYDENVRKAKIEVMEAVKSLYSDLTNGGIIVDDDKIRDQVLKIFQSHIYPLIAEKYGLKIENK